MSEETDMLFDVPVSGPPRIERLRRSYAEAKAAYDTALEMSDEWGDPIPREIRQSYCNAERELSKEESWIAANKS